MPELFVITSDYLDLTTTSDIDAQCIAPPTKPFANGSRANNHLNLGYDETPEALRQPIVNGLADLVVRVEVTLGRSAEYLAPVPNGANGWVDAVNGLILPNREIIRSTKLERRKFSVLNEEVLEGSEQRGSVIVFDDATTDGGTTEVMADHLTNQLGLDVIALISIYYRGILDELRSQYNRAFLIARHIPLLIDMDHHARTGMIKPLTQIS